MRRSGALYFNRGRQKRRERLVRSGSVGNERADIGDRTDQRHTDDAELVVIGHHDRPSRLFDHRSVNGRLIRIVGRQAALGMNAVDADERLVDEQFPRAVNGSGPDEREP